jgi:glyoxylase-like metal-dependent hydrolase (beta-lactamase superfamily II)/8-oxo-dGTP pyrophosphatase MutT (NUDIX family)
MTTPPVEPRPAATVVLIRTGDAGLEVLLTRRPSSMPFAADAHVFPGGRVDVDDADEALLARGETGATSHHVAAIRELFEEAGVLLADGGSADERGLARSRLLRGDTTFGDVAVALDLRLRTDALVPLSRWVTPPGLSRRFDARFFAAALPEHAVISVEGDEVVETTWLSPRAALDAMADGGFAMWLPTASTLQQLEFVDSLDVVRDRLRPGQPGDIVVRDVAPRITCIQMPSGGGVDGQPVNAYLIGDQAGFVLIDPGDPTGPALDRAVQEAIARGGQIEAIALTQTTPDHAGGAEALRERLDVPIFVGPGGGHDLPHPTADLAPTQTLPGGVLAVPTPGPRPEHTAFLAADGGFVISGDLDGRRGARSVFGPADTDEWRRSEARLREIAPAATWLGGHPGSS